MRELLAAGAATQQPIGVEAAFFLGREPLSEVASRARLAVRFDLATFGVAERQPELLRLCFGVRLHNGRVQTGCREIARGAPRGDVAWVHSIDFAVADYPERLAVVALDSASGLRGEAVALPVAADLGPRAFGPPTPDSEERTELPPLRLLLPLDGVLAGREQLGALVARPGVARVRFLVDGRSAGEGREEPWEATWTFDREALPHTIEAVALAADGRELARDLAIANLPADEPWVRILALLDQGGAPVVRVRVGVPRGRALGAVELFAGERLVALYSRAPFEVELPEDARAVAYVRAVARFDDDSLVEDVLSLGGSGFGEVVDVSLVEVFPRFVDERGRPVQVRADELELFDQGVGRPVQRVLPSTELPLLLGISVDTSGSMAPWVDRLKTELAGLLGFLAPGRDRAFLSHFSTTAVLDQPPTTEPARLARALRGVNIGGATALYDGIVQALIQFDRKASRRAVIILTDGYATTGRFDSPGALAVARRLGVPVFALVPSEVYAPGQNRNEVLALQRLALRSGGALFDLRHPDELAPRLRELFDRLRAQTLVTFTPAQETSGHRTWRRVEIRPKRPGIRVEGELGYFAGGE